MYTVVRHYKIKAGTFEQVAEKVREEFISIVSSAPGFIDYYLVNTNNNTIMTISIFEDQAGAYQSTAAAAKWVKASIADLVETPPTILAGEITVHHMK